MNMLAVGFQFLQEGFYIDLNWLGQFVKIIIEGVGVVGIGVVVFTLILKAITTPFDVYQRVKMRKQTLIMRGMKEDLEKLQKIYANDKQTYQTKMMELQKKNGYNPFGACLPMIISLVILIVAVWGFNSYSQYANLEMYEQMAHSYNEAIRIYTVNGTDDPQDVTGWENGDPHILGNIEYTLIVDGDIARMQVKSTEDDIYIYYRYALSETNAEPEYFIDVEKLFTNQQNAEIKEHIQSEIDAGTEVDVACANYFHEIGAAAAAEWFRTQNNPGFLWIKNVWFPDVSYKHPIQDYSSFTSSFSKKIVVDGTEKSISEIFTESDYEYLTADLAEEKEQANGYYIMIILTIGLMVLSQFLSMKSQKESDQYQTVDGNGARSQKIMMVVMPLIYAITGFAWTAAFSIYIAVSSLISILVTLLSNLIIGRIFKKKEEAEIVRKYTRTLPWQQNGKDKKNKK